MRIIIENNQPTFNALEDAYNEGYKEGHAAGLRCADLNKKEKQQYGFEFAEESEVV